MKFIFTSAMLIAAAAGFAATDYSALSESARDKIVVTLAVYKQVKCATVRDSGRLLTFFIGRGLKYFKKSVV